MRRCQVTSGPVVPNLRSRYFPGSLGLEPGGMLSQLLSQTALQDLAGSIGGGPVRYFRNRTHWLGNLPLTAGTLKTKPSSN